MSARQLAVQLLATLDADLPRLERIDDYVNGLHDDPYMPDGADDEYRLLAKRSVSNWIPLLVGTPAQALYVDDFRKGRRADAAVKTLASNEVSPEMKHWQESRLDARQSAVYRGALTFGHSFTLTEKMRSGKVRTKGLSALRTAALFEDPANDLTPYVALYVTRMPSSNQTGRARMWDGTKEYQVSFKSMTDDKSVKVTSGKPHGASECPVTRFAALVDLEGRTIGVVEPVIALQNRINQTIFDLLLAQTYASTNVRTATGMAPPLQMELLDADGNVTTDPTLAVDQRPKRDANGNPMPVPMNHNAKRFLFAEDPEVEFGSLPASPLDGFIASIDMSIRHLSAVSQTPPHHLLGQIANLSAEALTAAETSLARKVEEFRKSFGESWERVFRLVGEMLDLEDAATDDMGEVIWRDMESRSLAQSADALGKLKEQLGIPARGLWNRVPGVTQNEIDYWNELADSEPDVALSQALGERNPATSTGNRFLPPEQDSSSGAA